MRKPMLALLASATAFTMAPQTAMAWGGLAHEMIDRAAIEAVPEDGPVFLHRYEDFIASSASLPDAWRGDWEVFSKTEEDPNHGWFREQFEFLKPVPRSRYEFILALHKHYEAIKVSDPATAARTNVRWTGTLPYAVMENYERLIVSMRRVREAVAKGKDPAFAEQACAFHIIRLGHYIGDGAQPLHDSVNSDGWRGDNPHHYTTDRSVHGRFEGRLVDHMDLTVKDISTHMAPVSRQSGDMFDAVLAFLDKAGSKMETVYQLEQRDGFSNYQDQDVRGLVYAQTAQGASMFRDMIVRAWAESAKAAPVVAQSPISFENPAFNPETGSAPAPID